jgi:gluconokinase
MVIVLMGVAGSGKTTVGVALAEALGAGFVDADALHAPEAVAKMARGEGLDEADRAPWIARIVGVVRDALSEQRDLVVACSALRAAHRAAIADDPRVRLVHLRAPEAVLRERLARRTGHFAGPELLDSQLAALEPPERALDLDATAPPEQLVGRILRALGRGDAA